MRVAKTVNGATVRYAWAQVSGLPQILSDGATEYVWGHELISATPIGGTTRYGQTDALGSVRQSTDGAGSVVAAEQYSAFGASRSGTGQQGIYGFAGEQTDGESGLVYLRARYYDPSTGRFLTRDPLTGSRTDPASQHPYVYVTNNPARWTDPTGRTQTICCDGGGGGLGGGLGVAIGLSGGAAASVGVGAGMMLVLHFIWLDGHGDVWYDPDDPHLGPYLDPNSPKYRGWTDDDIKDVVSHPDHTRPAQNDTNKDGPPTPATAYCDATDSCVVVDDQTGEIVQVEDKNDPNWVHNFHTGKKWPRGKKPPPDADEEEECPHPTVEGC